KPSRPSSRSESPTSSASGERRYPVPARPKGSPDTKKTSPCIGRGRAEGAGEGPQKKDSGLGSPLWVAAHHRALRTAEADAERMPLPRMSTGWITRSRRSMRGAFQTITRHLYVGPSHGASRRPLPIGRGIRVSAEVAPPGAGLGTQIKNRVWLAACVSWPSIASCALPILDAERRRFGGECRGPHDAPYPGGGTNPPAISESRRANSIEVPSSHIGAMIWIPTGSPARVKPTGATVAGNPANPAKLIQNDIAGR